MGKKTLDRTDIIATIGYEGSSALIDKAVRRQCAGLSTAELARSGFFRAAAASAINSGDSAELEIVASEFSRVSGSPCKPEFVAKLFGVGKVSVTRSIEL